jgi:PAS domain S-box-containing protein
MTVIIKADFAGAVIDAAPVVISDMDTGEILYFSRGAEDMFRVTVHNEMVGVSVDELVPPDDRDAHRDRRAEYARAPASRTVGGSLRLYGCRRDGTKFPAEVGLWPVVINGRRCVISVVFDVSGGPLGHRA